MSIITIFSFTWRFALIFVLFAVFFMVGSGAVAGKMPTGESEPGLVSSITGLVIMALAETMIITALILTSPSID